MGWGKEVGKNIEEYVDFDFALSLLQLSKRKKDYFDGVTKDDFEIVRV